MGNEKAEPTRGVAVAQGWEGRDLAAKVLKWSIRLAPLVLAAGVSIGLSVALPAPSSWSWAILRIVVIAALSMSTITIVERAGRQLLPLSTLLRLSLVFPDSTPSRFKMALKAGSGRRMERELTDARANGLSQEPGRAAEQLVLLSTAIGAHDRRTRGHSERVRLYAELLGEELHLDEEERRKLQWAALIHDMGKITVPPAILNKKGKPTDAEWAILQSHPMRGESLVSPVAGWLGEWVHAVGGHHERWDGTGYPRKLSGRDIPRAAAIVAVADSFEVMTAVRSYKSAMSLADARVELTRCSGTHFNPDIVRAFLNISLPKLRRAGGTLASLAHVPFIGKALTTTAKAPEAWGYALGNMANAGGTAVATATLAGVLIAAPVTADSHPPTGAVAASAVVAGQPSPPTSLAARQSTNRTSTPVPSSTSTGQGTTVGRADAPSTTSGTDPTSVHPVVADRTATTTAVSGTAPATTIGSGSPVTTTSVPTTTITSTITTTTATTTITPTTTTTAPASSTLQYSATGPVASRSSSGTLTVSYAPGTQQNDAVLLVEVNSANQTITTPSGWTLLADQATNNPSQFRFTIWWKPADIGETSVPLTVHTNASGASAWVIRYTRPSGYPLPPTTAALLVPQGTTPAQPTATPSPDVLTVQPNATVISIVAVRAANPLALANPAGFLFQTATTQSAGQGTAIGVASQALPSTGSIANSPTWTQNGATAQWAWATIALA
jgi:hypothetical protein